MELFKMIIAAVIGGLMYYTICVEPNQGATDTPYGVSRLFLEASRESDFDRLLAVTEAGAARDVRKTAVRVESFAMGEDWIPVWQRIEPQSADDAWACQVTGKGQILVVEVNWVDDRPLIHSARLNEL
jgi:hypothetical protein